MASPFLKFYIRKWIDSDAAYPENASAEEIEAIEVKKFYEAREYDHRAYRLDIDDTLQKLKNISGDLKQKNDATWKIKPLSVGKIPFASDDDFENRRNLFETDKNFVRWVDKTG